MRKQINNGTYTLDLSGLNTANYATQNFFITCALEGDVTINVPASSTLPGSHIRLFVSVTSNPGKAHKVTVKLDSGDTINAGGKSECEILEGIFQFEPCDTNVWWVVAGNVVGK
jgi:hypothetical protein